MATANSPGGGESSPASGEPSSPPPAVALEGMESRELKELLAETVRSNETLTQEAGLFEKFLKRLDPKDIQLKVAAAPSSHHELRARKKPKTRAGSISERVLRLTVEQKFDIATRELDELREEKQSRKEGFERAFDNHRAVVGEVEQRMAEMKKSAYEFDRDIVRGALNPRTGKILGEKVVRYYEDRLRSRDTLMEKLRLKNSTLRVRKCKLAGQLKQKEEAGEVRHEVDFEQLKIENKQFNERFEEKNQELLKLKLSAGNTLQVLNSYKKKLHSLTVESDSLAGELGQRRELLARIEAESRLVGRERDKAAAGNTEARRKLDDYKVPDVMEYVSERASLYELSKSVKAWERKTEIAEMALHTYKQTWKRLCQQTRRSTEHAHRPLDPMRLY